MLRFVLSVVMAIIGVVASSLIVWQVANSWQSFSDRWLVLSCVLPVFGVLAGCALSERLSGVATPEWHIPNRLVRFFYALVAGVFSGLGGYLAFVITSRTWFADRIEPAASGFFYQVFHPSVLPSFYENGRYGSSTQQSWWLLAGIGLLIGIWVTYSSLGRRWNA